MRTLLALLSRSRSCSSPRAPPARADASSPRRAAREIPRPRRSQADGRPRSNSWPRSACVQSRRRCARSVACASRAVQLDRRRCSRTGAAGGFAPRPHQCCSRRSDAATASQPRTRSRTAAPWTGSSCSRSRAADDRDARRTRASGARSPPLDSLPNDPLLRDTRQWGLWNVGGVGGGYHGGVPRADIHVVEAWRRTTGDNALKLAVADTASIRAAELAGLMPDGSPASWTWSGHVRGRGRVADSNGTDASRRCDGRAHERRAHFASGGVAGVCGGDGALVAGCRINADQDRVGTLRRVELVRDRARCCGPADVGARDEPVVRGLRRQPARTVVHDVRAAARLRRRRRRRQRGRATTRATRCTRPRTPPTDSASRGASTQFDDRATFSSYGPGLDFVAPGVNIWTTFMTYPSAAGAGVRRTRRRLGTSFAAPIATGRRRPLLAAARPELIENDFQHVLRESAGRRYRPAGTSAPRGAAQRRARARVGRPRVRHLARRSARRLGRARGRGHARDRRGRPGTLDRFAACSPRRDGRRTRPSRCRTRSPTPCACGSAARSPRATTTSSRTSPGRRSGHTDRAARSRCALALSRRLRHVRSCRVDSWVPLPPEYALRLHRDRPREPRAPATPVRPLDGRMRFAVRAWPSPFRGAIALAMVPRAGACACST